MGVSFSVAGVVASIALTALALVMLRRPRKPGDLRLFPWSGVLFIAIVAVFLFAHHLANLFGLGTGE